MKKSCISITVRFFNISFFMWRLKHSNLIKDPRQTGGIAIAHVREKLQTPAQPLIILTEINWAEMVRSSSYYHVVIVIQQSPECKFLLWMCLRETGDLFFFLSNIKHIFCWETTESKAHFFSYLTCYMSANIIQGGLTVSLEWDMWLHSTLNVQ